MIDPGRDRAEALLQEKVVPKARCSGKVLLALGLLTGVGLTVLLGHVTVQGSTISMALLPSQYMQPMKAQIQSPMKAWNSLQPARVQQFRQPAAYATSNDADVAPNDPISASRRVALASGLAVAAMPNIAWAENRKSATVTAENAEALREQLLKQQEEAAERKARRKRNREEGKSSSGDENAGGTIGLAAGASVLLSLPFFFPNVQRLATKIISGGKDDGYGGSPPPGKRTAGGSSKRRTVTGRRGR